MADFRFLIDMEHVHEKELSSVSFDGFNLIVTLLEGTPYVFQSLCPHDKAGLMNANIEEHFLFCPRHRACFDLFNGEVSSGWRIDKLKRYPARIRHSTIEIDKDAVLLDPPEGKRKSWNLIG